MKVNTTHHSVKHHELVISRDEANALLAEYVAKKSGVSLESDNVSWSVDYADDVGEALKIVVTEDMTGLHLRNHCHTVISNIGGGSGGVSMEGCGHTGAGSMGDYSSERYDKPLKPSWMQKLFCSEPVLDNSPHNKEDATHYINDKLFMKRGDEVYVWLEHFKEWHLTKECTIGYKQFMLYAKPIGKD